MSERLATLPKEHIDFVENILDDAGIPPLPPEVEAEMFREKPPGHGQTEEGVLEVSKSFYATRRRNSSLAQWGLRPLT